MARREDLANIAERAADVARHLGLEPRVAFVSFSTFGYPRSERAEKMHQAPSVLERAASISNTKAR